MPNGVIIEKGPMDWQIFQQENGKADIELAGKWYLSSKFTNPVVFARVVSEDNGFPVIPWTKCNVTGENEWQVVLKDVPAGGLYRIETCVRHDNFTIEWATRGDMRHHIGVGDIFIIAGQSNSAGYGRDTVYDPPEPGLHVLRHSNRWDMASHPLNDSTDTLHEANRERSNPGHSPYLSFARQMKKVLGYPIGLIPAALGGSPLKAWNPDEQGTLYRNMMDFLKDNGITKVKGVLWYQGCSDADKVRYETYRERFINMVSHWRRDMNDDKLPFFTVQINRFKVPATEKSDMAWSIIREAQRQIPKVIDNIYVIPSLDCMLSDLIHNSAVSNMMLGERLARLVLNTLYVKSFECFAPDLKKAEKTEDNKVLLTFDNVYGRLYCYDVGPSEIPFTIIDEKGTVEIEKYAVTENNVIMLECGRKLEGKCYIHGAYGQDPKGVMPVDFETHIPILAFYNVEIKDLGKKTEVDKNADIHETEQEKDSAEILQSLH